MARPESLRIAHTPAARVLDPAALGLCLPRQFLLRFGPSLNQSLTHSILCLCVLSPEVRPPSLLPVFPFSLPPLNSFWRIKRSWSLETEMKSVIPLPLGSFLPSERLYWSSYMAPFKREEIHTGTHTDSFSVVLHKVLIWHQNISVLLKAIM